MRVLKERVFPEEVEKVKIIPITKPGKENSRGIKIQTNQLNKRGKKVLEKLLINRIMHIYSNTLINPNQYGFTPKNATDAALAIKEYIEEGMREGHIAILVSLDVKGAFDAAWWPSTLNTLKEFNCPNKLI